MTRVATSWLVYRLSGSALLLGTVSFAGQIPTFLLAPFAGVWVDRLDRRQVLVWTQALSMVQSLALAALTLSHHITIPLLLALSVLQGTTIPRSDPLHQLGPGPNGEVLALGSDGSGLRPSRRRGQRD